MQVLRWKVLSAALLLLTLAVCAGVAWFRTDPAPGALISLEATLLEPVAGEDGVVEWTSRLPVVARWTLTNHGSEPLNKAVLGANCQCHVLAGLPESLAPGKSVEVSLKIIPPPVGTGVRKIPVLVLGQPEPVATLPLRLRVPVKAPQWLVGPSPVSIRTVVGQKHQREVVLDSIESSETEPRLSAVSVADETICQAVLVPEQRPWGDDGQYVLRKYRITLTPGVTTAGKHHTEMTLTWVNATSPQSLPITIEAMPSLLVTPAQLSLSSPTVSRRLMIVPRVAECGPITAEADSNLIRLKTVTLPTGALTVEVRQLAETVDSVETHLIVRSGAAEPIRVPVQLAGTRPASPGSALNERPSSNSEAG